MINFKCRYDIGKILNRFLFNWVCQSIFVLVIRFKKKNQHTQVYEFGICTLNSMEHSKVCYWKRGSIAYTQEKRGTS